VRGRHASLGHDPSHLIGGRWIHATDGAPITSHNPARPADAIWSGAGDPCLVSSAVAAAREAFPTWSSWPRDRRFAVLRRFKSLCEQRADRIAELIADETGKVLWDAKTEAAALAAKVDITLDESGPLRRVSDFELSLGSTRSGRCWFRPHGVMAVIGPFNFPVHLPNGHIIPALAMGNTIVFKPSDKAPATGQLLAELLQEALDSEKAPPGVVNLIHGAADVAKTLVAHCDLDGILFTGSWPVGRAIMQANLDRPGRILALEMGGNNAAVVMPDADLKQAAIECVRSAFISTGQRCTCTRRVIIHEAIADKFIPALCKAASNLIVGDPRATHPVFMGPIISEQARRAVLDFQSSVAKSAELLVPCTPIDALGHGWYLSPGILRIRGTGFQLVSHPRPEPGAREVLSASADTEIFGPLLRISTTPSLDDAIAQTNATRFGLAASIFTHDPAAMAAFQSRTRAGCININTGTAGASSKLPFGGLGLSGNHRPAGSFSLDYCAYPVAGMIESADAAQLTPGMRFDDAWLR
jgi:succinylglutamic semialdehyde dehydrogenase